MQPSKIVSQADPRPLQGDFGQASEQEVPKPNDRLDDPKDGFDRLLTQFVERFS